MTTQISIPTLTTDRLTLRAPGFQDFDTYAAFRASPRSVTVGGPYDRETAFAQFSALIGHWHLRGYGRWMVADKTTDAPLGIVGLFYPSDWPEPEITWSMFDGAEGHGYSREAALDARGFAYGTLGWSTVMSAIMPDNTRSIALAKRLGAQHEKGFAHPKLGTLQIWRHAPAEEAA